MGKAFTPMNVVFDTGSDWLVVQGSDCSNCEGAKFDGAEFGIPQSNFDSERLYGSASLVGREYKDQVCLNPRACVNDFEYYLINQQTGLNPPIEGILGLSMNSPFLLAPDSAMQVGPLYIEFLVQ
jgi:hypothetical protein